MLYGNEFAVKQGRSYGFPTFSALSWRIPHHWVNFKGAGGTKIKMLSDSIIFVQLI